MDDAARSVYLAGASSGPMDAIKLLKEDHDNVKRLLQQFESADGPDAKRRIAENVIRDLMVHEQIEEQIFYPAYKRAAGEDGKTEVAEAKEEHHVVDLLIDELQDVDIKDEKFEAKFTVLSENVRHHIKEEEDEMFPQAKRLLKDKLEALGEEMEELKNNLMEQAQPKKHQTH